MTAHKYIKRDLLIGRESYVVLLHPREKGAMVNVIKGKTFIMAFLANHSTLGGFLIDVHNRIVKRK